MDNNNNINNKFIRIICFNSFYTKLSFITNNNKGYIYINSNNNNNTNNNNSIGINNYMLEIFS